MASGVYTVAKGFFLESRLDWASSASTAFKMRLVTTSYGFMSSHLNLGDITNELTAVGYSPANVSGRSVSYDYVTNKARCLAAPTTWASIAAGETIGGAIVTSTTSGIPVFFIDLTDTPTPSSGVEVVLATSSLGWMFW